jgi:Asp-tRNA(Asn)/Glu-tRNA(Gln) amidotransferase A subunit family amidase
MCRYVEDCVLVFNAIYGPDKRDGTVADAAFKWNPDQPLAGIRIAYARAGFEQAAPARAGGPPPGAPAGGGRGAGGLTPEQAAAQAEERRKMYQAVLETYRSLGAKLEPVDLPDLPLASQIGFILEVESAASFDELTRSGDVDLLRTGTSASTWPNTFKTARFTTAVDYLRAQRGRTILMKQMADFMSKFDVLLSAGSDATLGVTNLTGHPAMTVKCGIQGNTPRVLMLTGQLYDEATLCRVALAYEQATDWKDKHPTLA